MNNQIRIYILLLILIVANGVNGQDSLNMSHMDEISYRFTVKDKKLSGDGAKFLISETTKSQYTLLGEYHGSKCISELTEALIPHLHEAGYQNFILELGPNTGAYLDAMPNDVDKLQSTIKALHQQYGILDGDDLLKSFPFFDTEEDAKFLGKAKALGWNLMGIDQEYFSSFVMHTDRMYSNLNQEDQIVYESRYKSVRDTLVKMYEQNIKADRPFCSSFLKSKSMMEYYQDMALTATNVDIVDAILKSAQIYDLNTQRKWYENNATRIKHMKHNLRKGIEHKNIDVSTDKFLVKMGGYHVSQGFSPLALYEIGNTCNELAEYHGNTAVNIGFMNRYSYDNGKVIDALESDNPWVKNHRNFISQGQIEDWVIIDLRPLREGFYYWPVRHLLNKWEEKIIQRFDLLIITPTEYPGTPNY